MKKTYHIEGMHCKACELLVKKSCECLDACCIEHISHKTGKVTIDRGTQDDAALEKVIEDCGYALVEQGQVRPKKRLPLIERLVLLLVALVITFVFIKVDVISFLTKVQVDTSLWVILLLGLIASVSTCLAVTGGVIIGFTEMVDKSKGRRGHALLHASFQGGRILGFFVLGALLGQLGSVVSISLGFASWMNAFIAIVFVYLGLQLLGFLPALSSFGLYLPDKWTKHILSQRNPYFAPIVGALTFFLPCGFTQSVQLMALASGSRWTGGLMMAMFAIGTLPGLLALGMGTSFAKDHRKQGFEYGVAMLLLVFGLFTFWGSASIWGWTDALAAPAGNAGTQQVVAPVEQEVTKLALSHNGYQVVPETTTLEAGQDYEITILPESDGLGCMSTVTLPRIDSRIERVIKGQPITYTITNAQPGQYSFVCGSMGMSQGKLVIQ